MTHSEFAQWVAYVELYGPVDMARRHDEPAARVAAMVGRSVGAKCSPNDFLPYRPGEVSDFTVVDPELAKHFQ